MASGFPGEIHRGIQGQIGGPLPCVHRGGLWDDCWAGEHFPPGPPLTYSCISRLSIHGLSGLHLPNHTLCLLSLRSWHLHINARRSIELLACGKAPPWSFLLLKSIVFETDLGPGILCCRAAKLAPGHTFSQEKKMQRNYRGLKITVCMHSWGEFWTKDTKRPKYPTALSGGWAKH